MGQVTLPNTSHVSPDANLFSNVKDNDQAIVDQVNGNIDSTNLASNAVTTAKITDANVTTAKLAGSITDAKLSSPNNSVYRTVLSLPWVLISGNGGVAVKAVASAASGASSWIGEPCDIDGGLAGVFDFASGDYSVTGLTTKFRVKMEVAVGATSPSTVTFNAGLYPLTITAGSFDFGTAVIGSTTGTTATPSLAINTISRYASSDFAASALLSDPGSYSLGVVIGSITVPAKIAVALHLQMRHT